MKKLTTFIGLISLVLLTDLFGATTVGYYATIVDKFENRQSSIEIQSPRNERNSTATAFQVVPGSYSLCVQMPDGDIQTFTCTGGTYNATTVGQQFPVASKYGLLSGYEWQTNIVE